MSNHIKTLILAGAIFMANVPQSSAMHNMNSDSACTTMVTRQFVFVSPGVSWINIDKVNNFLMTQGISSFKEMPPMLSIGRSKEIRKLIFESNLTLRYWHDNVNSNLRTSLFVGDMAWNSGINVVPATLPVTFFPYVGIGVGLNSLRIRSDAMVWQAAFLLNAGAGSNIVLTKKDSSRGLVLGIRAGYLFDPFTKNRNWHSSATKIEDLPALNQSGAYIRLIIGGWGHHKKVHV